jgi:hypothetical protein
MKITQVNNINFYSRGHLIGKKVKIAVPAATLAAVGDSFHRRRPEQPINEYFDDIVDVNSDQIVLDDNVSFDNYYHIDMFMCGSKAFRDNELFNPLLDDEQSYQEQYDENDIKTSNKKNILKNNYAGYELSNKFFKHTQELPDSVTKPSKYDKKEENIMYLPLLENQDYKDMVSIQTRLGKITDKNLQKLAILLINNNKDEKLLTPEIENIVYKVKKEEEPAATVCKKLIRDLIEQGLTNTEIDNYINEYVNNYKIGAFGLMKYYNPKTKKYNKKQMIKDKRFDLLDIIKTK